MRHALTWRVLRFTALAGLLLAGGMLSDRLAPVAEADAGDGVPHLRLVATSPAADSTLAEAPTEIRLFFSEAPQMRGTTVRLTRGTEELVASTEAAADPEDPKELFIRPASPLAPGTYTVHWRVIAEDGHTQRGTFAFRVTGSSPAL
jgi:methionine-rich copper-binding protein CopC